MACLKKVGSSKSENEGTRKRGNINGAEASTVRNGECQQEKGG